MADFDPSGVWEARSLAGTGTTFNIGPVQPNGSFSGSANIPNLGTGQGTGWALGRLFVFKIDWSNRTAHLFSGWLDADRIIRGSVVMVGAPQSSVGWGSLKEF
jgi:hypothetical protein